MVADRGGDAGRHERMVAHPLRRRRQPGDLGRPPLSASERARELPRLLHLGGRRARQPGGRPRTDLGALARRNQPPGKQQQHTRHAGRRRGDDQRVRQRVRGPGARWGPVQSGVRDDLSRRLQRRTRDALVVAYGKGEVWGVAAFATATGKPCWRAPVHWTQVLVADNHVIVSCTDALVVPAKPHAPRLSVPPSAVVAFDLATGAQRWRLSCAELPAVESRRLHCAAEGVVVLWTDKELEILDLRTGKPRFRTAVELALIRSNAYKPALVCPIPGDQLVISDTTTRMMDLRNGKVQTVCDKAIRAGVGEWCCGYGRFTSSMFLNLLHKGSGRAPDEVGSLGTSGTCGTGPALAYHTVYLPGQGCSCAPAWGRQRGLAAAGRIDPMPVPEDFRQAGPLEKGPAYNRPLGPSVKDAWPLARGDAQRSAAASVQIGAELKPRWSARPQGVGDNATFTRRYVWRSNYLYSTTVTPPVVAANRVVYALPMEHVIVALDAGTGREAWRFEADGPVDSAPALVQGRAVFGCRDGAVYCLDLTDGALCWRRGLSPVSQRINVYGQLENRCPAVGAVLPDNEGQVLATAGFNGQQRVIVARLHVGTSEVSEFRLLPRGSYPNDMLVADADGNVWLNYQPISPTTNCPATSRLGLDNFTRGHTLGRSTRDPKLLANLP
ncbi:MAG: PQQ-binding-like beta-propeller repeat protein, partial [Tepidisphaeraceae bacterium]